MPYLIVDVETNGMQDFRLPADDPSQPYIASLAFLFVGDDMKIEREFNCLIKPDGWSMTPETTAINGLTDAQLEAEGIPIAEALKVFSGGVSEGRIVVGHNVAFDLKCVRGSLRRSGLPDLFEITRNICTMRALTDVCKIPPNGNRGGYKWPKLSEAAVFFGFPQMGDHSASADATVCYLLLRKMHELGIVPKPEVHYAKEAPAKPASEASRANLRKALEKSAAQLRVENEDF